jgi:hypothetical protein
MVLAGRFSRLGRVTLPAEDVGCGDSGSATRVRRPSRLRARDRYGATVERVRILLAGAAAERVRYGRSNRRSAGSDWARAVAEARRLGLGDARAIDVFLRAQDRLVRAILSLPRWWAAVEAIAAALLERGTLSARHARRLWEGVRTSDPEAGATTRHGVPSAISRRESQKAKGSMRGKAAARHRVEMDARVRPLVRAMARVPGLRPFSSCGGHADHEARGGGSVPAGQFFVSFSLPRTRRGWDALDRIVWAAHRVEDVDVVPWHNSDPYAPYGAAAGSLDFEIRGRADADPTDVADALRASGVHPRRARRVRSTPVARRARARRRT